jgi:hypothetical protein
MRQRIVLIVVIAVQTLLINSACGYGIRSSVGKLPDGVQSIGIPTFRNLTTQYKIEQIITGAVLKEFSQRTRVVVNSNNSGVDLVLFGEINHVSSTPVIFGNQSNDSQTYSSAFLVTVKLRVKLVRQSDSVTIWQNDEFLYRDRYVLNTKVRDFFSEENPALDRLARNFAASLASAILHR